MKTIHLVFALVCCTLSLQAQLVHIPADYSTIQAGIDAASPTDTVLVDEGTYFENIDFMGKEQILATMMTNAENGDEDARWDTSRVCEFAEILGFYGLCYWYTYQVSVLGIGPIWMGNNQALKEMATQYLKPMAPHGLPTPATRVAYAVRLRRITAAKNGPNLFHQTLTVSWLISIPRS